MLSRYKCPSRTDLEDACVLKAMIYMVFNCCDTEKKKNVPIKWTLPWKFSRVCLLCLPGSVRSKATTASMSNTPIIGLSLYVMVEHSNTYEIHYEKLTSRRPACAPLLARPERISGLWSLPCCILKSQWWQLVTDDDMLIVWRFSEQKILIKTWLLCGKKMQPIKN